MSFNILWPKASGAEHMVARLLIENSPLRSVTGGESATSDVVVTYARAEDVFSGIRVTAVSAYTGETLFRCQDKLMTHTSSSRIIGGMLHAAFVPGGELYKKVVAQRALRKGAPAAAVSSAGGAPLTAEQIAQIVSQTVKAQSAPKEAASRADFEPPRYSVAPDPKKFAVIVGVENYADLPAASYAERDAAAFKSHALALGYPERNIMTLLGTRATKAGLVKSLETWLPRNVDAGSTVLFYFSGHGAPDPSSGQAYLLPSDGDPQFLDETAYSTKRLYDTLGKLKTNKVLVVMDACFSGAGGRSVLAKGTRPLVTRVQVGGPGAGVVSLAAAGPDQITGGDDASGHGLFTSYLLRGLNGAASSKNGRVTARGLLDYAVPNVRDAARRQNRDQTPALLAASDDDITLR